MVFVPTEDAVRDAISGAVRVLSLSLGDCSACREKYTHTHTHTDKHKLNIPLPHSLKLMHWLWMLHKLTVPVSAEIQCCSFHHAVHCKSF